MCSFGEGIQVSHERREVLVMGVWFKSELVFQGDSKCEEEVDSSDFAQ